MVRQALKEISLGFISSEDPGWSLGIDDENEIELFDPVWMVEEVICREIKISNDLISSWIACRPQINRGEVLGLNKDNSVLIGDGDVHLRDALSIFSVNRRPILPPEFKGEVLKGMAAKVPSFDGLF